MFNDALHYMETKLTAVVCWLSSTGAPQAATVFFWITDNGDDGFRLFFVTRRHTRKFDGLERDPRVAVVVGTEFEPKTMQIEGVAKLSASCDDFAAFMKTLDRYGVPPTQLLLYANSFFQGKTKGTDFAIFEVVPSWARFMDYNGEKHDSIYHQIIGEERSMPDVLTPSVSKGRKRPKAKSKR